DDPRLTCRGIAGGRDPIRLLLDTEAATPPSAAVFRASSSAPGWIFTAEDADPRRQETLRAAGARVVPVPRGDGGVDLSAVVVDLLQNDVVSVLVEGGGRVLRSMLREGLADKLYLF